ncbi:Capsule synthesis protein, CapA [Oscillatoria nigro-viridis PCC 7112]|uniref:Capsule synthesis protein, CapA n=1 Tax=Phormidium nigroviride PCC 7112 TaxID=179408 RepID=K9VIU9_9CYAN|nr:CapA family protein [Oscillatoria nigro-viridis]AFZ07886.1 Capsule synthesis protein, CapA [Oscillatoria nigro-viridis PCC 7112]
MVYAENWSQPSILELARSGNFQALNYWIDSLLRPEGIYARVEQAQAGCVQILVEFQREFAPDPALIGSTLREGLVKFICHQLWRLNSPAVEGVRIHARLAGDADILWKQSVRIVTPANRQRRRYRSLPVVDWVKFKTYRSLLLVGSALASFILGCWVSYHEAVALQLGSPASGYQQAAVISGPPPKRADTVQAALEVVPVVQQKQVANPYDPTVTLMFGGNVNLSDALGASAANDHQWAFANMDEYRQADVAMVNLENSLTRSTLGSGKKQLNFKAAPESVKVLTAGGVDIVNLANSRAMDYEEPGLVETMNTLDNSGIQHLGAGRDIKEARRPDIIEVKGQRIAYLGYYDSELNVAEQGKAGTNPRRNNRVAEDIRALRGQVDWIIVNYHWGVELADYPGDWQIDLARFTIDQGADLVVGHHPQVLQGAEIYKGRPIVYSLGNFIFGPNARRDYDTAVLKVSLKDRNMKVEFLPVEVKKFQPKVVKGAAGDRILKRIEQISSIFDRPMRSSVVLDALVQPGAASKTPNSPLPGAAKSGTSQPGRGSGASDGESNLQGPGQPKPTLILPALPAAPQQPDNSSFFPNGTGPAIESNPPGNQNLPPRIYPTQPQNPSREPEPFTKEPFIKEPFISPPSPSQGAVPSPQSYLPPTRAVSFEVALKKQPASAIVPATSSNRSKHRIALPPIAGRIG